MKNPASGGTNAGSVGGAVSGETGEGGGCEGCESGGGSTGTEAGGTEEGPATTSSSAKTTLLDLRGDLREDPGLVKIGLKVWAELGDFGSSIMTGLKS